MKEKDQSLPKFFCGDDGKEYVLIPGFLTQNEFNKFCYEDELKMRIGRVGHRNVKNLQILGSAAKFDNASPNYDGNVVVTIAEKKPWIERPNLHLFSALGIPCLFSTLPILLSLVFDFQFSLLFVAPYLILAFAWTALFTMYWGRPKRWNRLVGQE